MSTSIPASKSIRNSSPRGRSQKARLARTSRRTTITLSPESQEIIERFKSANGTSTSAAIDRIIQRSEPKPSRLKEVNGFLVLDVPSDRQTAHFTLEDVKELEDETDREYVERFLPRERRPAPKANRSGRRR